MASPVHQRTPRDEDRSRHDYDRATEGIDAPLAIVDIDAFDANLADLVKRANGVPIRLASKSVRCRFLLERALAAPGTAGVLAYSLAEALWLYHQGASRDIVVAYPTVDAGALRGLAADAGAREAITVMVDAADHLGLIDRLLGPDHPTLRVCLELDVSWRPMPGIHVGPRRSPVHTPEQAAALARQITARAGFELVGLMGYEGQIAGVGDAGGNPASALAVRLMRQRSTAELAERRAATVRAVREVTDLEFVNGGGTGSIETTVGDPSVTEVAAGSGLIGPTLFDEYRDFQPRPAVLFALPVVRKPASGIATLFSGGYVASGAAGRSRLPRPHLPAGLRLLDMEGAGEVQTPVTGAAADDLAIGDKVWLRHAKAGELAERVDVYHVVSGGQREQTVLTYRGEAMNFG